MYGSENELNLEAIKSYMKSMHNVRYFMPPFPGNDSELDALARYIQHQQIQPEPLDGPQIKGVNVKEIEYKSEKNDQQ